MPQAEAPRPDAVRLGLIGDNIARSQSPRLHELAGRLTGLECALRPADPARPRQGLRGGLRRRPRRRLPRAQHHLSLQGARGRRCSRSRTRASRRSGRSTPWSSRRTGRKGTTPTGRVSSPATRRAFGERRAGRGLHGRRGRRRQGGGLRAARARAGATCGWSSATSAKAEALADALRAAAPGAEGDGDRRRRRRRRGRRRARSTARRSAWSATTARRCRAALMAGAEWAFDAVYTPVDTRFLTDAEAGGPCDHERLRTLLLPGPARLRDLSRARDRRGGAARARCRSRR